MNVEEWRAKYRARLIERGVMPGLADDVTQNVEIVEENPLMYTTDDDPVQAADDELAEWADDEGECDD